MERKIRFPLEMRDGMEVRNLEELRENFSLERVLFYIENGKMQTWLCDRYLSEIADSIEALDKNDTEYNRKLEILRQYTDEKKFLDAVDITAFEPDDV